MSEPDSYIIDIKDDENTVPITSNIVTGISNAEIINRYRDYKSRYKNNPQLWKWERHQTTSDGDIESGFNNIRRLYDERISDNEILSIVKKMKDNKNYTDSQIAGGVLINFINGRNQFGYIIDTMNHQRSHGQTETLELDLVEKRKPNECEDEPNEPVEPIKIIKQIY